MSTVTVGRAKATAKNPHGVAEGQVWMQTDYRPKEGKWNEEFKIVTVNPRWGYAVVSGWSGINRGQTTRKIRLDRFSPQHHYRLVS